MFFLFYIYSAFIVFLLIQALAITAKIKASLEITLLIALAYPIAVLILFFSALYDVNKDTKEK
jgi:hypothetical protein